MSKLRILVASVLCVGFAASHAHAGGVALESYTGKKPASADAHLSTVLATLAKEGFETGSTVNRQYEADVSWPSKTLAGLPRNFAAQLDAGYASFGAGKWSEAIATLAPLVVEASKNAAEIAGNQALLDKLKKAHVVIALSQHELGDARLGDLQFAELLRAFPSEKVSASFYGAKANQRFLAVKQKLTATSSLTVRTIPDTAVIYIDEQITAPGTVTQTNIVAGEYRVIAKVGQAQVSRTHVVKVAAGATANLVIDVGLDSAVQTGAFTGFEFDTAQDRAKYEATYAAAFASAIGASSIAVVGLSGDTVVGSLVGTDGKEIRSAGVAIAKSSPEQMKRLAMYILGAGSGEGLEISPIKTPGTTDPNSVVGGQDPGKGLAGPTPVPGRDDGGSRFGPWKWVAAVAAAGVLGVGGYLIAIDGTCPSTPPQGQVCADLYQHTGAAIGTLAGGAALAGLAIYMFVTDKPAASSGGTAFVMPTQGGAYAGYSLTF